MDYELRSARYLAAEVRERVVQPGDHVIDATVGNGHDTCHLAELIGPTGHLYGFDIQQEAVSRTAERLKECGYLDRCELYAVGHQLMADYVHEQVRLIVFNLGWLPGGNKELTTLWSTTRQAVEAGLRLLLPGGVMTICAYPGHAEGDLEREELTAFLSSLRPQDFNVLHQRFLNAGIGSPECFVIQKQAGSTV